MTSLKRYALYHAKSTLLRGAVLAVICLLLCFVFLDVTVIQENGVDSFAYISLSILPLIVAILSVAMPLLELDGFKNRRNLDALFSLPVSRTKMAAVHFLNGLLQIVLIYSLCVLFGLVRMLPAVAFIRENHLLPFYLLTLLGGLIIYAVFCFVLVQADTTSDGVILMLLYALTPYVLLLSVNSAWLNIRELEKVVNHALLFSPLADMATIYERAIENPHAPPSFASETLAMYIFWCMVALAATVGYFLTFPRHRAERVGGLSETFFGYRVLIPLLGISLMLPGGIDTSLFVMIFIAMTVGYIIYRRSVRLRRSDLIMLAVTTAVYLISTMFHP